MSNDDGAPPDVVASVTKGALDWAKEQAVGLVNRFKNRDLAFIEDEETIENVRSQRNSAEWQILSNYIVDKDLRIIAQMGLTLRKKENDHESVVNLRNKILKVFGKDGLHIAEAVQNEVLSTFIGSYSPQARSQTDLTKRIEKMLREVDKYIVFISTGDSVEQRVRELETRMLADVPDTIILYGCLPGAIKKVRSISSKLSKSFIGTYNFTANESTLKIIVVVSKK